MSADQQEAVDKAAEEVKQTTEDKAKEATPEAMKKMKKKPATKSG